MRRIQVITQKELVVPEWLKNCTVTVIDVFLATSTIACLLEMDYESVYAVKDREAAKTLANKLTKPYALFGELNGASIDGFLYPDPTKIKRATAPQEAIICSTNGTRAIEAAKMAQTLFTSSLLNGHQVAKKIHYTTTTPSIVLICSGNAGRFSLEDFIGAGQIIFHLMQMGNYQLSDAAKLAKAQYEWALNSNFQQLLESETSQLLQNMGYPEAPGWIIDRIETFHAVPRWTNGKLVNDPHSSIMRK